MRRLRASYLHNNRYNIHSIHCKKHIYVHIVSMRMRIILVLVLMMFVLSVQPIQVVADTGDNNGDLTEGEETKRGFAFIVVGSILGAIGYKGAKRVWNNIDESEEENDRSQYYLFENLMKLSLVLLLLGVALFIGGVFHIV